MEILCVAIMNSNNGIPVGMPLAEQMVGQFVTSPRSMNSPGGPMSVPRVVEMVMPLGGLSLSSPHLVGAPSPRVSSALQGSNAVLSQSQSRDPMIASASSFEASFEEPPIDPDLAGVGIYLSGEASGVVVQKITPGSSADQSKVIRGGWSTTQLLLLILSLLRRAPLAPARP